MGQHTCATLLAWEKYQCDEKGNNFIVVKISLNGAFPHVSVSHCLPQKPSRAFIRSREAFQKNITTKVLMFPCAYFLLHQLKSCLKYDMVSDIQKQQFCESMVCFASQDLTSIPNSNLRCGTTWNLPRNIWKLPSDGPERCKFTILIDDVVCGSKWGILTIGKITMFNFDAVFESER